MKNPAKTPSRWKWLWTRLLTASLLVAAFAAACRGTVSSGGDSNTNWLRSCRTNADCGALECVCGICTKSCSEQTCGPFGTGASCFPVGAQAAALGCPSEPAPPTAFCTAKCARDADCASIRANFVCRNGGCFAPPTSQSVKDGSPQNYPDAGCAGNDFPAVNSTGEPFQIIPCDCARAPAPPDDFATARAALMSCALDPQLLRCGAFYAISSFGVDYGGIDFYDATTGRPVGSFSYGFRDTCVAYDPVFTGVPTPCVALPLACRQDDGGILDGGCGAPQDPPCRP